MEVSEYMVTLGVRPGELSGLKELPGATKDRLTPLLLLAPWLATTPLARALVKFEESYPHRPYFVDVDTYYQPGDNINDSKVLWQTLAGRPADVSAWHRLLEEFPYANPCLLLADQSIDSALMQIDWARHQGRTFCIRLNVAEGFGAGIPIWLPLLIERLSAEGAVDFAVVFDFGWVRDALSVAALASGYTNGILSALPAQIPIAVCCTSFPKDFTPFSGVVDVGFHNRELLRQIQQTTNRPRLIYGDWGTTRPRSYGHGSQPKNRIDYPTDSSWVIAREQSQSIDFRDAAARIVNSAHWSGNLGVWGEQLIEATANGQAFAIDTIPKMVAARINIHLHRQAYHDGLPPPSALDEQWSDDDL